MFELGAKIEEGWSSDNKTSPKDESPIEVQLPREHRLWFRCEKRRGKWVTLCGPFSLEKEERSGLLKELKQSLGRGGTWKEDRIEMQGACEEVLRAELLRRGFGLRG